MSSVNWIFLKCFYLASTGRTRIWMVFKRPLLLLQFLEYRGENVHKHTHKRTHVCVCMQNLQVPVPLPQVIACKTIHSVFSLYLIPILYHLYYISDCSSCIHLTEDAMLTDLARISKSHRRKVLQHCRKWCYLPEC